MDIVDQINAEMTNLKNTIAKKQQSNTEFKAELQGKIGEIKKTISLVKDRIGQLKGTQGKIDKLDTQISELNAKNLALENQIKTLTAEAEKAGVSKAELQKQHDEFSREVRTAYDDVVISESGLSERDFIAEFWLNCENPRFLTDLSK